MRSFAAAALLCVPLLLASCDDASGPFDGMRMPAAIGLDASDVDLNDGDTLQVTVHVFDQDDKPFSPRPAGLPVEWTSDDESIARVVAGDRLVGVSPGLTTVRARLGDLEAEATVAVHAVANAIVAVDVPTGGGRPSAPLPDSVVLQVLDRHGNGVAGVEVQFVVTAGGGTVSPGTALSDGDGLVRVEWTLGAVFGPQAMQASLSDAGEPLTIETTIARVVRARFEAADGATRGASLPVALLVDSELYSEAIGAAHVVVTWDPSELALTAPIGAGDYGRVRSRLDAAAGQLHLVALDPALARGARIAAWLTFDVIGDAGASAAISVSIEQLVGVDFSDVTAAGIAEPHVVLIEGAP